MNAKRVYYLMSGLVLFCVLGIAGGAYGLSGVLGKQSDKLLASKAKLDSLNQERVQLQQSKKDIATYSDLYKISRSIVPENKDQAEAVRQIINLAQASGVTVGSISFPPSTLGSGPSGAATATSTTSTTTITPPTAASVAGNATAGLSQLKKVSNIGGVYVLELTVASSTDSTKSATYPQLIHFLSLLEQNRLTALVSRISITPVKGTSGNSLPNRFSFELTLDIYIKP